MPEMDKKIAAHKWATSMEPGENQPLVHELFTRYLVVQATDVKGAAVPIDYEVVSDTRLQVTIRNSVDGPVTVVLVG